jgi:(heptosyl)LPS beta-1,4-glucosyltransferase
LIAALFALAACALLHELRATAVTNYLLQVATFFLIIALLVRVADNFEHRDLGVRYAAWLSALVAIGGFAAGMGGARRGDSMALAWFAVAITIAWLLIGFARGRWLARSAGRPRGTTLSVSVICRDEADRIGRCLEAVAGWADQIVVLDSGSTDGTVEIARRHTAEVTVTDWPGYGPQKQRALERCTGEWVLSLDADEVISPELKREIDAMLAIDHGCSAFRAPWVSVLFGGPIDFGADGRYHTRLFRRDAARFDDAVVHEEVVAAGRVGTLEAPVYHYTFRDLAHLQRKFGEYARLSAESRYAKGRRSTRLGALIRGGVSFLLLYFVRLGVLDGRRGVLMARHYARYTHDKYAGLVAIARGERGLS